MKQCLYFILRSFMLIMHFEDVSERSNKERKHSMVIVISKYDKRSCCIINSE